MINIHVRWARNHLCRAQLALQLSSSTAGSKAKDHRRSEGKIGFTHTSAFECRGLRGVLYLSGTVIIWRSLRLLSFDQNLSFESVVH